jgi:hypothetical protein
MRITERACDKFNTTGKSLLVFRISVKPRNQKYFTWRFCKSELQLRRLIPEEGRRPSSLNVGMGCGGRFGVRRGFAPDENAEAYGEVVWSWRRDAGAKLCGVFRGATVAKKPVHRGEHEVSRKAIAQGMSECFRSPVCSCAPKCAILGTRDRGWSVHPAFPAPSLRGGATNLQKLGRNAPRE